MSIKTLPLAMRPRERLLGQGPQALASEELLAVLLRTGGGGMGVLDLARHLLREFKSLSGLLNAATADLARVPGLGPAKRAEIAAVMELARRAASEPLSREPVFGHPQKLAEFASLHLSHLQHEIFALMFLDAGNRLIGMKTLFRGTLSQASVYPREVVREALAHAAASVVLVHNHPSGVAEPSQADEHLTRTLCAALALVDVRVLDHLVVGRGQVTSFAQRGLL